MLTDPDENENGGNDEGGQPPIEPPKPPGRAQD